MMGPAVFSSAHFSSVKHKLLVQCTASGTRYTVAFCHLKREIDKIAVILLLIKAIIYMYTLTKNVHQTRTHIQCLKLRY